MNAVVSWIKTVIRALYRVTGVTARHTRALRNVNDWAEKVYLFIDEHGINDDVDVEKILGNSGEIKLELTTLTYNGRGLLGQADKMGNKQAVRLISEITENMDTIRRYMFSPALQKEKIRQALIILHSSCNMLKKNLAEIESP